MSKSLSFRSVLGCLSLAAFVPGCFAEPGEAEPIPSAEPIAQDSRYGQALLEKSGSKDVVRLDLGDDQSFQLLKNRMVRAGFSQLTAPDFAESLEISREEAVAQKLNPYGDASHGLAPQDGLDESGEHGGPSPSWMSSPVPSASRSFTSSTTRATPSA